MRKNIDEELVKTAVRFHGHLGPFLMIGLRMGLLAKELLNSDGFHGMRAEVDTGTKPPFSCIVDGIQVSTGCTLGRGRISVRDHGKLSATFTAEGVEARISLKEGFLKSNLDRLMTSDVEEMKKIAREILSARDDVLFDIEVKRA